MITPSAAATSARDEAGPVIPRVIELTESLVHGDIRARPRLTRLDRSLITSADRSAS